MDVVVEDWNQAEAPGCRVGWRRRRGTLGRLGTCDEGHGPGGDPMGAVGALRGGREGKGRGQEARQTDRTDMRDEYPTMPRSRGLWHARVGSFRSVLQCISELFHGVP